MKQIMILEFKNGERSILELEMPLGIKQFSLADGVSFKRFLGKNGEFVFYRQMGKSIGKGVMITNKVRLENGVPNYNS